MSFFSSMYFDNLHCLLSIVRAIWNCIRTYVEGHGCATNEKFGKILRLTIREHYVNCYDTVKSLAVMHGEQVDKLIHLS